MVPEIFFPSEPQGTQLTLEQNLGVAQGLVALRVTRLFLNSYKVRYDHCHNSQPGSYDSRAKFQRALAIFGSMKTSGNKVCVRRS